MIKKLLAIALLGFAIQAHAVVIQCDYSTTGSSLNPNANCDTQGSLVAVDGRNSSLNITAATVVKASSGRLVRINVLTAGSTTGTANDATTTGGASASNEIFSIPNTVGSYYLDWPVTNGIVIIPGTSQVISVSYQ